MDLRVQLVRERFGGLPEVLLVSVLVGLALLRLCWRLNTTFVYGALAAPLAIFNVLDAVRATSQLTPQPIPTFDSAPGIGARWIAISAGVCVAAAYVDTVQTRHRWRRAEPAPDTA